VSNRRPVHTVTLATLARAGVAVAGPRTQELPDWVGRIRSDHPRLFFNPDTWAAVKARAQGAEKDWYARVKRSVDHLAGKSANRPEPEPQDLGPDAAQAAFCYWMTGDRQYFDLARKWLWTSIRYYEQCYEKKTTVNWYSTTRVHAIMAWDWLYNDLEEPERREMMERFVDVIENVLNAAPRIYRENYSDYTTGFYGVHNCLWFMSRLR